ncbi:class I SAM-dependent methyltransferase [Hyphomicrobiales bacterium]|jgi:SAM-dependent methyltransferase|nr:class I SAM-dependent methyltransferase [Hyphomicrobiales bacterium]|tara:strand:- start:496 stop:1332 length:837 start_codon:yes stop_codon:yes gene_type:complete
MIHDRKIARIKRERSFKNNPESKLFFNEYSQDMFERIELINNTFEKGLALGFRNINLKKSKNIGHLRLAELGMSQNIDFVCDEEFLPIKKSSLDIIISFFNLHSSNDIPGILFQINQSLKPNGLFIGCLFVGDTLKELRFCLAKAEEEITKGISPRISPFADLQDLSNLLQRANFNLPVADIDRHKVTYDNPIKLMNDLREMGETNILKEKQKTFFRKDVLERSMEIYKENFSLENHKIFATFEIAWLIGWKYHDSQQKPLQPGSGQKNLAEAVDELD